MERKEEPEETHTLPEALKEGIVHVEQHPLKHVEIAHDASAPVLPSVGKLLHEITEDHVLKHVEQVHDTSAPLIDPNAHIGENQHNKLLSELTQAEHPLKHTEIVHDASAPVIDADVHVGTNISCCVAEIKKPDEV